MNDLLSKLYYSPHLPTSLGGAKRLYKYANKIDPKVTMNDVKHWLSTQYVYTLYKPAKREFGRNKIYATYVDENWQIDLLDYVNLSRYNSGYKYLIVIIDVFSKFLRIILIKNKSMKEIIPKFELLFKKSRPQKIQTDRGLEFDNIQFRSLCKKYNIVYFTTQNQTKKCSIVERMNRTLRTRIQRLMASMKSRRYIDKIDDIVRAYNNSEHRSIKMKPIDVNYSNENKVFRNLFGADNMLDLMKQKQYEQKFEENNDVRVKFDEKVLDKGYHQKWSDAVYKIDEVLRKYNKPQYTVKLDGQKFKRRYYPEELQRVEVNKNTDWPIEKILKYQYRDGTRQALVKFKGYDNSYNQWIEVEKIQRESQ